MVFSSFSKYVCNERNALDELARADDDCSISARLSAASLRGARTGTPDLPFARVTARRRRSKSVSTDDATRGIPVADQRALNAGPDVANKLGRRLHMLFFSAAGCIAQQGSIDRTATFDTVLVQ